MTSKEIQEELAGIIISENQILELHFVFNSDKDALITVADRQLEVKFDIKCEFEFCDNTVILKLQSSSKIQRITTDISRLRSVFSKIESAYDVVGE